MTRVEPSRPATTHQTGAEAIRAALLAAMEADPSVVLLGDSVGRGGGVAGTTQGLRDRFGPDRVIDVPIADRAAAGLAVGLALGGRRPILELPTTGRLPAVLEVLGEAAAFSAGDFPTPVVVRVPYGTEARGLDRVVGDVITGLTVAAASDPGQAAGLLRTALAGRGPVVVLEPRGMYADRGPDRGDVPFRVRVLREGTHVTLAAWGCGVTSALAAADELTVEGIRAEVVDLVLLSPFDREGLGASVRKTGRLVVVHPGDDALADHVRRIALDEGFLFLESPLANARDTVAEVARAARSSVSY